MSAGALQPFPLGEVEYESGDYPGPQFIWFLTAWDAVYSDQVAQRFIKSFEQ